MNQNRNDSHSESAGRRRSLSAEYGAYRRHIRELIDKELEKPAARASLAAVGTLFLIAFLAVAALRPTLITVGELIKEIEDEDQAGQVLDTKIMASQTAQKILGEIGGRVSLLDEAVPETPEFDIFSREIEFLAAGNELAILEFTQKSGWQAAGRQEATTAASPMAALPITITVGGSESAVRSFVSDLELIDRLAVLDSVKVSGVPAADRLEQPYPVKAEIQLKIFYRR